MPRCTSAVGALQNKIPPVMFAGFALDCKVADESIEKFLKTNHCIRQISVVGQFGYRNVDWEKFIIERCEGDDVFLETRKSLAWFLHMANDIKENRKTNFSMSDRRAAWEVYLGSDHLVG